MSRRVLVCGSRTWDDDNIIHSILDGIYNAETMGHLTTELSEFVLIQGGAKGADAAAKWWAECSPMHSHNDHPDHPRFEHLEFPAKWDEHDFEGWSGVKCWGCSYGDSKCRAAGPRRNIQMLNEGKPNLVLAFSDDISESKGTRHMARIAKTAGVPVYVIGRF